MSERKKKNTIEKSDSVDKNDQSEASKLEKILDDIIKVCPKMKDDKQFIINKLTSSKIDSTKEYVLDKIKMPPGDFEQDRFNIFKTHDESFYVDPYDNIINSKREIVGVFNRMGNGAKYLFFVTHSKMPDKLVYPRS